MGHATPGYPVGSPTTPRITEDFADFPKAVAVLPVAYDHETVLGLAGRPHYSAKMTKFVAAHGRH